LLLYPAVISAAISASAVSGEAHRVISPDLDTRYALEKFQEGSDDPVASLRCFQMAGADDPFTLPSLMRYPTSPPPPG